VTEVNPQTPGSLGKRVWQFKERHPWELGFADYFRDWVAPELERIGRSRTAAERLYRRRLALLLGGGSVLVLLVAEASGSLPITLLWAVMLVIIGGALAHSPIAASRTHALNAVRDRVIGFYGLSPMATHKLLQSELRASGFWDNRTPITWADQYWGIHRGTPVRLARLRYDSRGSGTPEPASARASRARRRLIADWKRRPDRSPNALVLLMQTGRARSTPSNRHEGGRPGEGPGELAEGPQTGRAGALPTLHGGEAAGIDLLADALGGAPFDLACDEDRVLILAHADLPALDWARLAEGPDHFDLTSDAASIERPTRVLLKSLHQLLSAAQVLADAHLPSGTCRAAAGEPISGTP
jgi:hypothetical protein